jgi:hypothetical protein
MSPVSGVTPAALVMLMKKPGGIWQSDTEVAPVNCVVVPKGLQRT